MKTAIIRSSWMDGYGYRLDTKPYVGGALQSKVLLEELPLKKVKLPTLTSGYEGGIFNGPHFSRIYVEDSKYGVPFLGGSDLRYSDLSKLPLLSNKLAKNKKLAYLEIKNGMTLITCSGTIGKMAYARSDMEGIWTSQHLMKVVPNKQLIPPGYLYAFLSSKFGVPLVTSGTYGAIIQSIEPHHLAEIPVPRLSSEKETEIHRLVEEAAGFRSEATATKRHAESEVYKQSGISYSDSICEKASYSITSSSKLESRLDSRFHSAQHTTILNLIASGKYKGTSLSEFTTSIFEPLRFKRIPVEASKFSVALYGSAGILDYDPQPSYFIQPPANLRAYQIQEHCVLIPRSGSIGGIIGTPVLPIGDVVGSVVTEDAIRINFDSAIYQGYAYICLSTAIGGVQLKARTYGSAIPHLDVHQIGKVIIPKLPEPNLRYIGQLGVNVLDLLNKGIQCERKATQLIEQALTAT